MPLDYWKTNADDFLFKISRILQKFNYYKTNAISSHVEVKVIKKPICSVQNGVWTMSFQSLSQIAGFM